MHAMRPDATPTGRLTEAGGTSADAPQHMRSANGSLRARVRQHARRATHPPCRGRTARQGGLRCARVSAARLVSSRTESTTVRCPQANKAAALAAPLLAEGGREYTQWWLLQRARDVRGRARVNERAALAGERAAGATSAPMHRTSCGSSRAPALPRAARPRRSQRADTAAVLCAWLTLLTAFCRIRLAAQAPRGRAVAGLASMTLSRVGCAAVATPGSTAHAGGSTETPSELVSA